MTTQTLSVLLGCALLGGCALPPAQTRSGSDHPASGLGADAPMPPRSDTLAIDATAAPRVASPADVKPQMHMKSMGGMKHDTPATSPATADHAAHGGHP